MARRTWISTKYAGKSECGCSDFMAEEVYGKTHMDKYEVRMQE